MTKQFCDRCYSDNKVTYVNISFDNGYKYVENGTIKQATNNISLRGKDLCYNCRELLVKFLNP